MAAQREALLNHERQQRLLALQGYEEEQRRQRREQLLAQQHTKAEGARQLASFRRIQRLRAERAGRGRGAEEARRREAEAQEEACRLEAEAQEEARRLEAEEGEEWRLAAERGRQEQQRLEDARLAQLAHDSKLREQQLLAEERRRALAKHRRAEAEQQRLAIVEARKKLCGGVQKCRGAKAGMQPPVDEEERRLDQLLSVALANRARLEAEAREHRQAQEEPQRRGGVQKRRLAGAKRQPPVDEEERRLDERLFLARVNRRRLEAEVRWERGLPQWQPEQLRRLAPMAAVACPRPARRTQLPDRPSSPLPTPAPPPPAPPLPILARPPGSLAPGLSPPRIHFPVLALVDKCPCAPCFRRRNPRLSGTITPHPSWLVVRT